MVKEKVQRSSDAIRQQYSKGPRTIIKTIKYLFYFGKKEALLLRIVINLRVIHVCLLVLPASITFKH